MRKQWDGLGSGIAVAAVMIGLLSLCTMGVSAVLARTLPQRSLGGYYLLLQSVQILALLAQLGTNSSLQRMLAVPAASQDWDAVKTTLRSALRLLCIGFVPVSIALVLAWRPLMAEGVGEPELGPLWVLAIPLVATQIVDEQVSVFFRATGRTRLGLMLMNLPRQAIFLAGIALLWAVGKRVDLDLVVGLRVLVTILTSAVGIGLVWGALRRSVGVSSAPGVDASQLARISLPLLVHLFAALVLSGGIDLWILGLSTEGASEVGVYGAMYQLAAMIALPLAAVSLVVPPLIAALHGQRRLAEAEQMLRRISTLLGWGMALLLPLLIVGGEPLIALVFGSGFERGYPAFLLLATGQAFNVAAGMGGYVLPMTGHQDAIMRITLVNLVVKLGALWIAVSGFGLIGIAAASSGTLVVQNVALLVAARRLTGLRTWPHANPLRLLDAWQGSMAPAVAARPPDDEP